MNKNGKFTVDKDCSSMVLFYAEQDYYSCYDDGDQPTLNTWTEVHECGIGELIKESIERDFKNLKNEEYRFGLNNCIISAIKESLSTLLKSKYFVDELNNNGYVAIESLDEEKRKAIEYNKFFVIDKSNRALPLGHSSGGVNNDLHALHTLAEDNSILVKKVSKESALNEEQSKIYRRSRDRFIKEEERKKASAQKRLESKKKREIEKAKKLLEKEGEIL